MATPPRIIPLILAAGASQRLGQPKQLVIHHNETLLNRAIRLGETATDQPAVVVIGSQAKLIRPTIRARANAHIVQFDDWNQGMRASLVMGFKTIAAEIPGEVAILILACDQIGVDTEHLAQLITVYCRDHQARPLAATSYTSPATIEEFGIPLIIGPEIYSAWRPDAERGAVKEILRREIAQGRGQLVEHPASAIDIDIPEDLKFLS